VIIWRGLKRETEVEVAGVDRGCGALEVSCPECGGTGAWPYHPSGVVEMCVECKGTGRILVCGP